MSWKYVLNGDNGNFKNCVEVSAMAGKLGYKFSYMMEKCILEMKYLHIIIIQELLKKI